MIFLRSLLFGVVFVFVAVVVAAVLVAEPQLILIGFVAIVVGALLGTARRRR